MPKSSLEGANKAYFVLEVLLSVLSIGLTFEIAAAQATILPFDQMSTEERLRQPGWWPTKVAKAREEFVGSDICLRCHASMAPQRNTPMARTMRRAATSDQLRPHAGRDFQVGGIGYVMGKAE